MRFSSAAARVPCTSGKRRAAGALPLVLIVTGCGLLLLFAGEISHTSYDKAKNYYLSFGQEDIRMRTKGTAHLPTLCKGKERVVETLKRAADNAVDKQCLPHVTSLLATNRNKRTMGNKMPEAHKHVYGVTTCNVHDICGQLPQWKQVAHLYGDKPVVIGMETCALYRASVDNGTVPIAGVAGLYNSGTNALSAALADCNLPQFISNDDAGSSWEVPWGKHSPAKARDEGTKLEQILPIVVVRDPFRWMASMVRAHSCCYSTPIDKNDVMSREVCDEPKNSGTVSSNCLRLMPFTVQNQLLR